MPRELGIKPEPAVRAHEALLKRMPDKEHGMTSGGAIQESRSHHKHEGRKALRALLAEKQIQGMGQVERARLIGTS